MNKDATINRIAHATGYSRKDVLRILKQFGMIPSKKNPATVS